MFLDRLSRHLAKTYQPYPTQREKIIGIDRLGGTGDFILLRTLRKLAIDPDKDVTLRQVGQSPVRLAALQAGSIDATTITVEDKLAAEKFGLKILIDIPKLGIEVLSSGVVTTRSFIKREEETVRRFMRSIVEGIHHYRTHKARSIDIMSKYMKVADPRLIEVGYDFNAQTYRQKPYPFIQGIQLVLEQLAQTNSAAKTANPERFIDARFVKELDANGFIDRLNRVPAALTSAPICSACTLLKGGAPRRVLGRHETKSHSTS